LLNNHSTRLFDEYYTKLLESAIHNDKYVIYRSRPFARELLTSAVAFYKPTLHLAANNPEFIYFTDGVLYARKWVLQVYAMFSEFRPMPFREYGY
jgi:hypothetical protein